MIRSMLRVAVVTAAVVSAAGVAAAQQDAQAQFGSTVEVNVVNLYVTVVDDDGQPVTGLVADDFVVREDGDVREITNFAAVSPRGGGDVPVDGRHGDGDVAPADAAAASELPTSVVFLFDLSSLEARLSDRLVELLRPRLMDPAAREYLVAVLINGQLEILQPFTSDAAKIALALETVRATTPQGSSLKQRKRSLERDIVRAQVVAGGLSGSSPGSTVISADVSFAIHQGNQLLAQVEALQQQESARISNDLEAMQGLVQILAGRPERKVLVWVGQDHALRPAIDVYSRLYDKFEAFREPLMLDPPELWAQQGPLLRHHQQLSTAAQRAGVSIYAIDPSDRAREVASADLGTTDPLSLSAGSTDQSPAGYDLARSWDLNDGAQLVAAATGGRLYANSRDLGVFLDDLEAQIDHYYSLGYVRGEGDEDVLRNIDVEVRRKGMRVRHHSRVRDASPVQRLVDFAASALHLGSNANPLGVVVQTGDLLPSVTGGLANLPLQVAMPTDRLGLVPQLDGSWTGQIAIAAMALGEDGGTSEPFVRRLRLRLPEGQVGAGALAGTTLMTQVDAGVTRVSVAVLDELSGSMSAVGASLGAEGDRQE